MKTSPDHITTLATKEIFVFPSNLRGIHGAGAAKQALVWGAKWGQASGLQGRTYGIPTKGFTMKHILRPEEIKPFVDEFMIFASARPDLTFLVVEIGCGLARYKPRDMAPLFKEALKHNNILLPQRFLDQLL